MYTMNGVRFRFYLCGIEIWVWTAEVTMCQTK